MYVPAVVGVPLMTPSPALIPKPGGREPPESSKCSLIPWLELYDGEYL
ncbi:MAG TPA: hypothetical protein VLC92_17785 [Rhodocyclaceae bacterium]|nr:hypothetical protein [Rhodocyclaceae bacterium]